MLLDRHDVTAQRDGMTPLATALQKLRKELNLSQQAMGDAIGEKQQTVQKWLSGEREPRLDDLRRIEDAFELRRGYILRLAGYVADVTSTRQAIEADTDLGRHDKLALIDFYDSAVGRARSGVKAIASPAIRSRARR